MRRNLTLILTAALIAGLATGCTEKKDNAVPVQSVAMLCGLTDAMQQQVFAAAIDGVDGYRNKHAGFLLIGRMTAGTP